MKLLKFSCFKTEWGWIAVVGSAEGLFRTILPALDERAAINTVTWGIRASREEGEFTEVRQTFIDYFKGKKVEFRFPVDLGLLGCTDFQRDVWEASARIPYGQLRSYGWIANEIDRPLAPRAVGQALGVNQLPIIIPCHRVVRSDGSLGGFSGGLHWKKKLIELENAVFISSSLLL